jgi:hypothetical protein
VVWQIGGQPCGPRDVAGLRADRVDAAEDHVLDGRWVDRRSFDESTQGGGAEVGRVHLSETAAASSDRGANGIDDEGLGH